MRHARRWKAVAAVAALILAANVASAELLIDDFRDPNPETFTVIGLVHPNPTVIQTPSAGVLGGERDLLIQVAGPPAPVSYSGTLGEGLFVFGSASSDPGVIGTLQYDGPDLADGPASLVNSQGLGGVDLTAHGTSFILDFNSVDGGNRNETDILIGVTGAAGTALYTGVIPDSPTPVSHAINFADFLGDDVFSSVSSITMTLNPSATPDVDFALDKVSVPEPTSMALLMFGGTVLLARRRRRRAR